jgi:plasmid stability protein
MSDFLIRDLDEATMRRLKERAESAGRSLQAEIKATLSASVKMTPEEIHSTFERWREEDRGHDGFDAVAVIRRSRDAWSD